MSMSLLFEEIPDWDCVVDRRSFRFRNACNLSLACVKPVVVTRGLIVSLDFSHRSSRVMTTAVIIVIVEDGRGGWKAGVRARPLVEPQSDPHIMGRVIILVETICPHSPIVERCNVAAEILWIVFQGSISPSF